MDGLEALLVSKNWAERASQYNTVFSSVEYQREVQDPVVSIIVISWRMVEELNENFRSLHDQRSANFELIFVNNGNTDEEFSSILPFVDTYVKLNTNTGAFKARNIGALFAKAPILIFLEDDGIPDAYFVKAHIDLFRKFHIISARGVYIPIDKQNPFNKLATHYYLGKVPFPRFADLEGNVSYDAAAFFAVGGWDDEIQFGHGGRELSLRLTRKFPDKRLQIYSPVPKIMHDYVKSEDHYLSKRNKQNLSKKRLTQKYPEWNEFIESWSPLYNKSYLLRKRKMTVSATLDNVLNYCIEEFIKPTLRPLKLKKKR